MSTQTPNIALGHKKVIAKFNANVAAERSSMFDVMSSSITLAIALYSVILSEVFKKSALPKEEWNTLRGGEFHGLVTGKKDHPFRYAGAADDYPSQSYLTQAFALHYMHTAKRLAEYRDTNVNPQVKYYCQWLAIMYGASIGTHCTLARGAEKTLAKWNLKPASRTDKAEGRSYASAVLKETVRVDIVTAPKDVRSIVADVMAMTTSQKRKASELWSMESYEDSADLLSMAKACVAEWLLRKERADTKAASDKRRAKQTT
jgi:hypothetical protein